MIASLGGALKETLDVMVPTALKHSTLYRIFVDNLLRYGLEFIGSVEGVYENEEEEGDGQGVVGKDYPVRKTVGNLLEASSIAAFHLSPLWIFAVGADVLKGGKAYVMELQQELVLRGLIQGDLEPGNAYQLMASLESTTNAIAANVDTPPLSKEALNDHADELKEALKELREALGGSREKLQEAFDEFQEVAEEAGTKMELAGVMTLSALQQAQLSLKRATVGVEVGADMLVDNLLLYYPRTLKEIRERGYLQVASSAMAPYSKAVVKNLKAENPTLTERVFKGGGSRLKHFLTGEGEFGLEWEFVEGEVPDPETAA